MRASRDAGSYLCNYLSWRAIEAVNADNGPASPPSSTSAAGARRRARRKGFPRITLEGWSMPAKRCWKWCG
jgi:pyroglutamyl-peptidase